MQILSGLFAFCDVRSISKESKLILHKYFVCVLTTQLQLRFKDIRDIKYFIGSRGEESQLIVVLHFLGSSIAL